ncbi:kinase-like domain-containing protein, partial [Cladochytrium replicatum]
TGRVLGSGSYAVVKEAIHTTTGKKYAVKIVSKKLIRTDRIRNELEILRKLSKGNPNIVKLHDTFETQNNVYFVMDLCEGGNLFEALLKRGKYDETDVARIIKVVVTAVGYLHENNIVHRDIKEGNLLFLTTDARFEDLLIADFGLSRVLDETSVDMLMTACGTPGYMAPEVVRSHPYGTPADMWSIGVLTFILLSGYMPFGFEHSGNSLTKILNGQYSFAPEEVWEDISLDAQDFISKLLLVDPSARMDARSALEHPWLLYAEQRAEEWAEGASRAEELARGVKVRLDEMKVVPPTPARSDPPVAVAAEVQGGEEVVKQGLPSVAYGTLNLTRNLKAFDGKRVFKRAVG